MKLFSWIHGKHRKTSNADSKTSSAGSALHSSCESYTSHLEEKKDSKCSTSRRQIHEFELCLSGGCSRVDDPFGNEFQTYQDGISVFVSHEQFGLLAIGTFGFNSFEGEPEFESLHVKQFAVQPDKLMLIKEKQLEESPSDVFGLDKGKDEVQMRFSCIFPADQDGSENSTASKNSKLLARGSIFGHETSFLKKAKCAKVVGWQGGKKVHPFNNTESSAAPNETIVASHIKEKLRNNLLKHCRILGSCFGGSVELAQKKATIEHDYSIPRNLFLSSRLKTMLSSEKCSSSLISAQDSTQAHDRYQLTKTSRFTAGEKLELQSRKINEHTCSRVTHPDGPEIWTAVSKDLHQKHLPIPRHHLQPRERAQRNPVNENWIKTDSEYVVLECL